MMSFRFPLAATLVVIYMLIGAASANAQYIAKDKIITAGQPASVSTNGAKKLIITYRPGSNISQQDTISVTQPSYNWMPRKAGIYALATPDSPSQTVSVQFGSFPVAGLIVFILAGTILFGGATFASINLFSEDQPKSRSAPDDI